MRSYKHTGAKHVLRVTSKQNTHNGRRGRSRRLLLGYQPDRNCWSSTIPVFPHHEAGCTLEMRGCLQARQSSQEDTSWWDSTSTRLR